MVGSTCAMSATCGPITMPSRSSTTTTGITSFGEANITSRPASAAAAAITSSEVSSMVAVTASQGMGRRLLKGACGVD